MFEVVQSYDFGGEHICAQREEASHQNTPDTSQSQVDSQASSLEDRGPASATDLIFFQM